MIVVRSRAWWRATLALCLGSLLVFLNLYVPQPLLPLMREAYGISTLVASLAMSVSTLSLAAALLVFGPLSDAIGRAGIMRLTLLLAGLLSVVLACVAALAPNFELLLVLRAVQGFVLGGLPAVASPGWEMSSKSLPCCRPLGCISVPIPWRYRRARDRRHGGEVGGISASFLTVGCLTLVGVVVFWRLLPPARCFQARRFRLREARAGWQPICAIPCWWALSTGWAEFPDLHQSIQLHHLPVGTASLRAGGKMAWPAVPDVSQRNLWLGPFRSSFACAFPACLHGLRHPVADAARP